MNPHSILICRLSVVYGTFCSSRDTDESDLIRKKTEYHAKGIALRTNKRSARSILTVNGKVEFTRYVLCPKTKEDQAALMAKEGITSVVPMVCRGCLARRTVGEGARHTKNAEVFLYALYMNI
jgi:hypothetical protein